MEERATTLKQMGDCLMELGASLMSSGANTGRVRLTIERISQAWGIEAELLITSRALLIMVSRPNTEESVTIVKQNPPLAINFTTVSGISRMSWKAIDQKWGVEEIKNDLKRIKARPHYNRWLILLFVSLAGMAFCRNMGGSMIDASVTFVATFAGLFVRQEAHRKGFNPYLIVVFAAVTATMIAGIYTRAMQINPRESAALATSVLFLIPGVPLINSFSDLIDGNLLNGIIRSVNGLIIAFSIALGLVCSWVVLGF